MTICTRCGGTGRWEGAYQEGPCFKCHGTGEEKRAPQVLKPHRARTFARGSIDEDMFVGVDLGGGGAKAEEASSTPSAFDISKVASDVAARITPIVKSQVQSEAARLERDIKGWTRVELDAFAAKITADILREVNERVPLQVELTRGGVALPKVEGHQHPKFATLLRLATSRDVTGFVPNIWISGPAGSGKTTGARNLARALEVPFYYNGALSTDFQVLGYCDAGGAYHTTAFREAIAQPSVYLFDDIDSCDSNAPLLALNGALANGLVAFPDAQVERHPDCVCIATANTWGLGATADYVGRVKIDAAFLSRFPGRIEWGYDEAFEAAICGNARWARRVQGARARARELGLKVVIDPRASIAGAAYLAAGLDEDEVAGLTYLANLNADQRRALQ
jgi:hypothetical protein